MDREAAATWALPADETLTAASRTFTVLVTRTGCNNGVSGTPRPPDVELSDDEVVLTFTVSPGEPRGGADCPGNDGVPYEVRLPEALRDRALIDGACRDGAEAAGTTACRPSGQRFSP